MRFMRIPAPKCLRKEYRAIVLENDSVSIVGDVCKSVVDAENNVMDKLNETKHKVDTLYSIEIVEVIAKANIGFGHFVTTMPKKGR